MSPRYFRNDPTRGESVTAALLSGTLAVAVGLVTFYVVRLVLPRQPVARRGEIEAEGVVGTER